MRRRLFPPGFTLLEVLVSLAIMAIAMTVVLQLFSTNMQAVARSGDMTSAAVRAEFRMREILAQPSWAESSWNEATADGYRLEVSIAEVVKERTDPLPVRLMEVVLTVHWFEGKREKHLSLKTMKLIDRLAPAGEEPLAPA